MIPTRSVRTFARLGRSQRRLLVEATAELLAARLQLLPLPGVDWQRALGDRGDPAVPTATASVAPHPVDAEARAVGWAVGTAAARVPWRSVCLPQAIAAQHMLRRRGIPARAVVGARRSVESKPIDLHVWVVVGERVVVGGGGHATFAPVVAYDV